MSQQSDHSAKAIKKWRNKYLDLIDKYDQLEKSSEKKQDQMRHALVVVSLLAEGQAESIDRPLETLREAIKPQNSGHGLEPSVKVLQSEVTRFEQQWQLHTDEILYSLQKASKNLLSLPCSPDDKRRIKKIVSNSKDQLKQWSGYRKQLSAWSELLSELNVEQSEKSTQKTTFSDSFKRLFKRSDNSPLPQEETATETPSQDDSSPENIELVPQTIKTLASTSQAVDSEHYDGIEKDISAMVSRLLTQLVIPSRYSERLNNLKEMLSKNLTWNELTPLLEEVSDLIIEALGNGQEEFEQFLQGLDQRLETIQYLINNASKGQVTRSEARGEFEGMLEGQVNEIRTEVSGKDDLGELGDSISEHLGLIVQAMHTFRSAENHREAELTKQLSDMQLKLNEMETLANGAQQAIEEQRRKAMHDALTGLPNRESYQQRLEHEVQRMNRNQGKLSLVIGDVDLFKRINDSYGHLAGDKVLKITSRLLQKHLRNTDFIARFGGEEFVILMPGTSAQKAKKIAEKLRKKVEESPFNFKKEPVQITISFGVGEFNLNESADDVFARADKALYKAKDSGRNQVIIG